MDGKVVLVAATRQSRQEFEAAGPLAKSLMRLGFDQRVVAAVALENRRGLPAIYNQQISERNREHILVFLHDDLWLDDYFFADRVIEGLSRFDVIGVAGNERRWPGQTVWAFRNSREELDRPHLSGRVGHGNGPFGRVSDFGPVPLECKLLDGVLLAARASTLLDHGLRFDERFDFHFYDLDFCRSAESKGLRMGTWPIPVTHGSRGNFHGEAWHEGLARYQAKWQEPPPAEAPDPRPAATGG